MKLQEFSFGNFKSFRDIYTLNLSPAKIKSSRESIDRNNVIEEENISFLKSKAIYGANASGKSNIISAFVTFFRIIKDSVKDPEVLNLINPFILSTKTENAPTFFQIIFWEESVRYRYGFEVDNEKIHSEWLFGKSGKRECPYFIREEKKIVKLDKTNFPEGYKFKSLFEDDDSSEENEIFRDNSLFLSTLATLGFAKLSKKLFDTLTSPFVISGLGYKGMFSYAGKSLSDEYKKKYILDLLKYGDVGIEDLEVLEITPDDIDDEMKNNLNDAKKKKVLVSLRKRYDENNNLIGNAGFLFSANESEGTRKLFELSPFIYQALNEQKLIIIDEFDARFHPLLTRKIVELFNSKENKGAQLIFTTHDTNLLSSNLLRRDQIEFVEKDKYGASHLYSLVEFKGVRNNAQFEKDYIQGKYGAIPFLGNFNELINTPSDNA